MLYGTDKPVPFSAQRSQCEKGKKVSGTAKEAERRREVDLSRIQD